MQTRQVDVRIKGISPLLMHRFPEVDPPKGWEKWAADEQAKWAEYRDPVTDELYIPGINIQRCLIAAGTYSKGKGRASLQKSVAACVLVFPECCSLGTKRYTVDSRPVRIPSTGGRIMRHRPRLDNWECHFRVEYDAEILSESQVREVVDNAGTRVGLLDFRPECKGPFGRFMVRSWETE